MISKKNITAILLLLVVFVSKSYSQVTIGLPVKPASGALLQLKDTETPDLDNNNITATKGGLLLPRMALRNGVAPSSKGHVGMMIYNISTTPPMKPGIYVWEGSKWILVVSTERPEEIEQ